MSQPTTSGTSSRKVPKDQDTSRKHSTKEHDVTAKPRSPHYGDSEWETNEAIRQRELEEVRARAAQMEKTMRWWSDCTANWREKWSKVRNERNKAREESKLLRTKLEIAINDAKSYKHESQELEIQNEQLRKEMEKIHMVLLKHAGQFDHKIVNLLDTDSQIRNSLNIDNLLDLYNNVDEKSPTEKLTSPKLLKNDITDDHDVEEYVLQGAVPKHAVELYKDGGNMGSLERDITKLLKKSGSIERQDSIKSPTSDKHLTATNDDSLKIHMAMLNLELEETTKAISAERDENTSLHRAMEKLKAEVIQLRLKCNELNDNKCDLLRELTELKERYQVDVLTAQADLLDETSTRENMDQRMNELRCELERLQDENAAEWGKRERLETDKITLERENKQLKNELRELQEKIDTRRSRPNSTMDGDCRQLQQDILDLKHANSKLKKLLAEKTTELTHALRRSEQYESEVKRIRVRVDELKRELANAQDEVDAADNVVRRLQRQNEDLIEQLESANVQIEHFKNSSEPCAPDVVAEIFDEKSRENNTDPSLDYEHRMV
ncbi:coiled-coil domain-containing protein 102A isoform X1 [Aphidius gifuensis]|nr:coiled-coil domain-containing protein 102A isoform X1 [Aphidius gifuensis]